MSAPLALVLTYIGIVVFFFLLIYFGGKAVCWVYDRMDETPEEQLFRETQRAAKQATKEYKKRRRMRSGFWNVFN